MRRFRTGEHPVIQRLMDDPLLLQLSFGVFVTIESDTCRIGEVGGGPDEHRAKGLMHQIED